MKHCTPITLMTKPAPAKGLPVLPECLAYLHDTWDFTGFLACWQDKKGCNCGDSE